MPDQMVANSGVGEVLHELAKVTRDSQEGYRVSAESTEDTQLRSLFQELSRVRGEQADELDQLATRNGGRPAPREGSKTGAIHRYFTDLKASISGNDRQAVLEEVARGEGFAEAAYDKALRVDLPADVKSVVQRQHDSVKRARDRARSLSGYGQGNGASGWYDQITTGASRSAEVVQTYVHDRPMTSSLVALGVGFLLGSLLTLSLSGNASNNSVASYRRRW